MEDFATKIQQGIDGHFATVSQQGLERQNAEAAKVAAEVEKQAIAAIKQKEIEDQERMRKEKAFAEAAKILEGFGAKEKLEYIKQEVLGWRRRGKSISPIGSFVRWE